MEIWKNVVGNPEYRVSNLGEVWSKPRLRKGKKGVPTKVAGRVLKPGVGSGYFQVNLSGTPRRVHLLVAEAFHGPRPEGLVCDHINEDKQDNRACNLRWVTPSENNVPAQRAKSRSVAIQKDGVPYYGRSLRKLAAYVGLSNGQLCDLINGNWNQAKGFTRLETSS